MITQTEINNGFLLAASEYAKEEIKSLSDNPVSLTEAITIWASFKVEDFVFWDENNNKHRAIADHNGWTHDAGVVVHIDPEDSFTIDAFYASIHFDDATPGSIEYLRALTLLRILEHMEEKRKAATAKKTTP
jgi:hypothetical protein